MLLPPKELEGILGSSGSSVTVNWDRTEDSKGRTLYSVRISESDKEVQTLFTPDELDRTTHVRGRMYHLWGDFLEARSRHLFEELARQ